MWVGGSTSANEGFVFDIIDYQSSVCQNILLGLINMDLGMWCPWFFLVIEFQLTMHTYTKFFI